MKAKFAVLLAAATLPLAGCMGGKVVSNVAVFHNLEQVPRSATYSVVPWRSELDNSLEFRSYALNLTQIMRDAGFNAVAPGRPADYIVYLDYGIDDGTYYEYTYNQPEWGMIADGVQTTTTVTETDTGQVINETTLPANERFGVTGYTQEVARGTTFERFVNIDILPLSRAGETPLPVYELRLSSAGWCGSIPSLMPRFMQAIAKRLDAKSGKAGKVTTGDVDC